MSDVPLGAMLSGGLDSSLITALMARNMTEPVKTFSIGFREAADANELNDARRVASGLGTEHHELELSLADADVDLEDLIWYLDEPVADLSSLGFLALSKLAAREVTVALSGQGADELLGGYAKHRAAAVCGRIGEVPQPMRDMLVRIAGVGGDRMRRAASALTAPDPVERLIAMSGRHDDWSRQALLGDALRVLGDEPARAAVRARANGISGNPLGTTLYIDGQLALVDDMLHYFDRASMAHSLEVRVPFLDHRLVEYAATIPPAYKVRGLQTKAVLKRAAKGLVPVEIIEKKKIGFFRQSVDGWFASQAERAVSNVLLSQDARFTEFLDRRAVEQMVRDPRRTASTGRSHLLLSILMLELWLSSYLPRALGKSVAARERIEVAA
jgi:asparagine synthase (glutamine-hydrolysing)